jgi:hypothetical protein
MRALAQWRAGYDLVDVWIIRDVPERQILRIHEATDEHSPDRAWVKLEDGGQMQPTLTFHQMEWQAISDAIEKITKPKDRPHAEFVLDELAHERRLSDRYLSMIEKVWSVQWSPRIER